MMLELLDCAVNPVVDFPGGRIQFGSHKTASIDIDPLKNHQVQIKNNQQTKMVPGLNQRTDLLQDPPGLPTVFISQETVFFHQISKSGGYRCSFSNLFHQWPCQIVGHHTVIGKVAQVIQLILLEIADDMNQITK